jgi:hypothetical protein
MGDKPINVPNKDVAQRGKVNEQHQNVAELLCKKTQ